jgi:hypothetical protein
MRGAETERLRECGRNDTRRLPKLVVAITLESHTPRNFFELAKLTVEGAMGAVNAMLRAASHVCPNFQTF